MKNSFIILLFLMSFVSCQNKHSETDKKESKNQVENLVKGDFGASAPYLFKKGNKIIVNWTEQKEKNTKLKYKIFDTETKKFGPTIEVTPAKGLQLHDESMAKIGMDKNNTLFAFYRRRDRKSRSMFGGNMFYSYSTDNGKTWSKEQRLVKDTTSTSQSFYDIALLPDGTIGISWLDNRKPIDKELKGKTLYFASTNKENKILNEKPVAGSTCECCRTDIYVDSLNNIHIAYRNIIQPGEPGFITQKEEAKQNGVKNIDSLDFWDNDTEIRDMYYIFSSDQGKTFTKPVPIYRDNWHISGCPHTGPSLALNDNVLGAVWFTGKPDHEGIYFNTKQIKDSLFSPKKKYVSKEGRHPQMIVLNGKFYTVYEEYYEKDGKGYEKIVLESIDKNRKSSTREISSPLTRNNHAVLFATDKNHILIVWVNTDTKYKKLQYKIVKI